MDNKEVIDRLDEVRKALEHIELTLMRLGAKTRRYWMIAYYSAVSAIPDYFDWREWKETEQTIYDSIVQEIKDDFTATGTSKSEMETKLLKMLKGERQKLLEVKEKQKFGV